MYRPGAEFHEWAHNLGKVILGYCMNFNYGLLLQNLAQAHYVHIAYIIVRHQDQGN